MTSRRWVGAFVCALLVTGGAGVLHAELVRSAENGRIWQVNLAPDEPIRWAWITGADTAALNETALNAFNVNGKQYGLPESFSNVVLIYNKDLFDQAGVAYPSSDWTQDDLQAAAEAIRALGDDIFGIWQPCCCPSPFSCWLKQGKFGNWKPP